MGVTPLSAVRCYICTFYPGASALPFGVPLALGEPLQPPLLPEASPTPRRCSDALGPWQVLAREKPGGLGAGPKETPSLSQWQLLLHQPIGATRDPDSVWPDPAVEDLGRCSELRRRHVVHNKPHPMCDKKKSDGGGGEDA